MARTTSKTPIRPSIFKIHKPEQLILLVSQVRQEILDSVRARGNCSAAEIADDLGLPHDTVYYHLHKLERAGLLINKGKRAAKRRHEEIFNIPGNELKVEYDLSNPKSVKLLLKMISSLLRVAQKDFVTGANSTRASVKGRYRNLWGARMTAWLNKKDIAEIGRLLEKIEKKFRQSRRSQGKSLHAISWIIAPLESATRKNR